ncbi:MAG TPA: N-acetylmuramoyl-L-alanine amidase [Puia sp.]|jgi:N-acetylmuramoyl-L-alanine amidase|nr:N-acetylmuramoyl-L-alanine amidase [Puia sp.]
MISPILRTIVIDPGHGGFDPGTHGLLVKEKDVALGISLKLGKALQQAFPGIRIVYTRTTDIMPGNKSTIQEGIRYRAELANRSNGDLFICIHCNSNGKAAGSYPVRHLVRYRIIGKGRHKRSVPVYATAWVKNMTHGTTTYIWKADRNEKKGAAVDAELRNGENMGDSTGTAFDFSTPEAMMRAQLYEKKYFANSALFGTLVEDEFARTGRRSYGVQQRPVGIGVLEATGMPSVLIETGYLTNRDEERYLASNKGQNEVARDIVNALKRYRSLAANQ